ncbi:MAG: DUF2971 domain-containing protein [Bacteroidota bacterium]
MNALERSLIISNEFMNTINRYLPSNWISGNGSRGDIFDARLSAQNSAYESSEYFYEGEKKFVHWTTFQNLMSIINSRQIRFYNLQNPTDENEFKYAADQLSIPSDQIDHSKNYLYTFSFCEIKEKENTKLWTKYGKNFSGVAIEFEIENDPKEWENFMMSRTYYELPEKLIKLIAELKLLKDNWQGIDTEIDLGRLIAFHKHPDFEEEKEIRISTYFPYRDFDAYKKNCNVEFKFDGSRPRITDYFGLYLFIDNDSTYLKSDSPEYDRRLRLQEDYYIKNPKIRITNIRIGEECGLSNSNYSTFKEKIEEVIQLKLGYKVNLPFNLYKNKNL